MRRQSKVSSVYQKHTKWPSMSVPCELELAPHDSCQVVFLCSGGLSEPKQFPRSARGSCHDTCSLQICHPNIQSSSKDATRWRPLVWNPKHGMKTERPWRCQAPKRPLNPCVFSTGRWIIFQSGEITQGTELRVATQLILRFQITISQGILCMPQYANYIHLY